MHSFEILCVLILCGLGVVLSAPIEDNNAVPQGGALGDIFEEIGTGVAAERLSRHLHRKKHQHYQVVDYHEPQPVAVVHRPQQSYHGGGGGGSFAGSSAQAGSFGHNSQSQASSQSASFNYGPFQASISSSIASSNSGGGGYGGGYFDY